MSAAWRKENPDRKREAAAAYYAANRDRERASAAARRAKNVERTRSNNAAYRAANVEKLRAYIAHWKSTHPDAVRASQLNYRASHPDKSREGSARRRARKRNAPVVERIYRSKVWERDGGRCHLCRRPCDPNDWHLEHIVPLAAGGEHSYRNVIVTCLAVAAHGIGGVIMEAIR